MPTSPGVNLRPAASVLSPKCEVFCRRSVGCFSRRERSAHICIIRVERATRKNSQLAPAQRVAIATKYLVFGDRTLIACGFQSFGRPNGAARETTRADAVRFGSAHDHTRVLEQIHSLITLKISSKSLVESPWRLPIDSNFLRSTSATRVSIVSLATTQ